MPNMSYCRFRNTLLDVQDCLAAIQEFDSTEDFLEELPSEERQAALELFKLFYEHRDIIQSIDKSDSWRRWRR